MKSKIQINKLGNRIKVVDTLGRIKERDLPKTIYLQTAYPTLVVKFGSTTYNQSCHRLIAATFIPNPYPDKYSLVNHIDKDKTNFSKENLEWCDAKWNTMPENQNRINGFPVLFERQSDLRRFTPQEFRDEYGIGIDTIGNIIRRGLTYKGSYWKRIDTNLEDYLSRHPLRDDWYQHPTRPNIRANGCGVLEVDGKLRVGCRDSIKQYYYITIDYVKLSTHRLLIECYVGRELTSKKELVNHIVPVSIKDTDNSINNLEIVSAKENSNNPLTVVKYCKKQLLCDLFGNLLREFESLKAVKDYVGVRYGKKNLAIANKYLVATSVDEISKKLNYIFYKFSYIDSIPKIESASTSITGLGVEKRCRVSKIFKEFLNTGLPAPDGYYYQQGDPEHMLYDPDNTKHKRKREVIDWKDRNKNNNEEGN